MMFCDNCSEVMEDLFYQCEKDEYGCTQTGKVMDLHGNVVGKLCCCEYCGIVKVDRSGKKYYTSDIK